MLKLTRTRASLFESSDRFLTVSERRNALVSIKISARRVDREIMERYEPDLVPSIKSAGTLAYMSNLDAHAGLRLFVFRGLGGGGSGGGSGGGGGCTWWMPAGADILVWVGYGLY
mmetsp:Transcript_19024/g.38281  ORF Transcript_19024/g.38281 Transcript_19024/m.38281 type:complete len:115 (-) Transcript_19024:9-353(-)